MLVNGATGTAGRLAVQIAKYLGVAKVIATARNLDALKAIGALGADVTIPLVEDETALEKAFRQQFAAGVFAPHDVADAADPIVLGMHRGELFLRRPVNDWAEPDNLPRRHVVQPRTAGLRLDDDVVVAAIDLAWLTSRASGSFARSSDMFIAEISRETFECRVEDGAKLGTHAAIVPSVRVGRRSPDTTQSMSMTVTPWRMASSCPSAPPFGTNPSPIP